MAHWMFIALFLALLPVQQADKAAAQELPAKLVVFHYNENVESPNALTISRIRTHFSDKITINDGRRIRNIQQKLNSIVKTEMHRRPDTRWVLDEHDASGRLIHTYSFDKLFMYMERDGKDYQVRESSALGLRTLLSCIAP